MPKKAVADYGELHTELGEVLARLQQPDVRVDEAVQLYEAGLKLVGQLEAHLQSAENTIKKIKLAQPES